MSTLALNFDVRRRHLTTLQLASEDPDLDADDTHDGARFGYSVIDIGSQCLQRNSSFLRPFCSGDFSATQSACHHDLDAQGAGAHAALNGLLHRSSESNTLFELLSDGVGNQFGFEIDTVYFEDIDPDIETGAIEKTFDFAGQILDSLTTFSNDHSGTGGVDFDGYLVGFSLDVYFGDSGSGELFGQELTEPVVFLDQRSHVLLLDEPARSPRLVDAESKTGRMYFLTQDSLPLPLKLADLTGGLCCLNVRENYRYVAGSLEDGGDAASGSCSPSTGSRTTVGISFDNFQVASFVSADRMLFAVDQVEHCRVHYLAYFYRCAVRHEFENVESLAGAFAAYLVDDATHLAW